MESYGKDLLQETVRFVEYCQEKVNSGDISYETYSSMAALKIEFMNCMVKDSSLYIQKDLIEKAINVIHRHEHIMDSRRECAGK